jgi:hypothetical protein
MRPRRKLAEMPVEHPRQVINRVRDLDYAEIGCGEKVIKALDAAGYVIVPRVVMDDVEQIWVGLSGAMSEAEAGGEDTAQLHFNVKSVIAQRIERLGQALLDIDEPQSG